jgi:purine-binding chemotaxis protein CheW
MSGELFGIDLHVVREFALVHSVTPVPCCPPHILGHINLRGELFTLVDLGAALGLPASAAPRTHTGQKVVVLDLAGMALAAPVDEVLAVRYVRPGEVAPNPAAASAENAPFLRGTAPHGAQMLSILDLPRIFAQKRLSVREEP